MAVVAAIALYNVAGLVAYIYYNSEGAFNGDDEAWEIGAFGDDDEAWW